MGARGDTSVPEGISQRWPRPPDGVPQQRSPKLGAQMPLPPSVLAWAQAPLSQEQARVLDQGVPMGGQPGELKERPLILGRAGCLPWAAQGERQPLRQFHVYVDKCC